MTMQVCGVSPVVKAGSWLGVYKAASLSSDFPPLCPLGRPLSPVLLGQGTRSSAGPQGALSPAHPCPATTKDGAVARRRLRRCKQAWHGIRRQQTTSGESLLSAPESNIRLCARRHTLATTGMSWHVLSWCFSCSNPTPADKDRRQRNEWPSRSLTCTSAAPTGPRTDLTTTRQARQLHLPSPVRARQLPPFTHSSQRHGLVRWIFETPSTAVCLCFRKSFVEAA